ncbi:MAG TPA: ArsR family transcriptional regulator [Desulfurivibrio alkaliphilus]|uniref:ArsR family transcriptional regulator n=1 Tax=Desulfurivibrio alkaliphilus TaxID=427923 RepID=A0A7C2TK60_9BACT|nr:ArsR family transcriptional regulator [Desulfurivibrio alkaliphilus]
MRKFTRVMKALSDPNRVAIVKVLARGRLCVCELTALLGLAQSTVSKHLRTLEEAGLVAYEKDGAWINYYLADGSDSPYATAMLAHLQNWLEPDPKIDDLLARLSGINRHELCSGASLLKDRG